MAMPSSNQQGEEKRAAPEEEDEGEDQFHLLSKDSRHFSLYPSLRKLRRKFAISMSHNGYGGVRNADYDHRRDCIDTNPATALDHLLAFKQEFVTNPAQTFQDQVKSAQKGLQGDFFLEMGLTKNLSILPDKKNVQDVADGFDKMTRALGMSRRKLSDDEVLSRPDSDDVTNNDDDNEETTPLTDFSNGKKKLKKKKRKIPISAYVQLLFAVTALSSIGPFLDRLDRVSPPLRIVWRQQGTTLVLWPFALRSILVDGPPRLSLAQWCTFLCASFSYSVLTVAFSASVDYTTVNDAAILTNSQSLLLVIAKLVIGSNVVFLEWSGNFPFLPCTDSESLLGPTRTNSFVYSPLFFCRNATRTQASWWPLPVHSCAVVIPPMQSPRAIKTSQFGTQFSVIHLPLSRPLVDSDTSCWANRFVIMLRCMSS